MKRTDTTLALTLALTLTATLALAQQTTPPPAGPARPMNLPPVSEHKLDNGLTVVLVPLANVPTVTAQLTFVAGQGSDAAQHPGIAELASRVLSEGTATRSSQQLKEELRSIGGSMNVVIDADTTAVRANAISEFTPRFLALLADVAQHPSFPASEVDLAKQNFAAEIEEERSSPGELARIQLRRMLYGKHPYGFVVPTPDDVAKLTREQLRAFAATSYAPNNAYLVIVGDLEPQAMFRAVEKAFGEWKRVTMPAAAPPVLPKRDKRQIAFIDRPGSVQSTILIGALAVPRKSPDFFAINAANTIYGEAFYSRLMRNIREAKGYTYSPYSSADLRRVAGSFMTSASVRNEVTGPTLLEVFYELDRMRVLPVTDEELASAKTYMAGNMAIELANQFGLAYHISRIYTYGLAKDFLTTYRERVDAVTADDVRKAASKYFDTYRSAVAITGDWNAVKDQVTPFGEVTVYDSEGKKK